MIGPAIVAGLGIAGQLASGLMGAQARRAEIDQQIRSVGMKRDLTLSTTTARAGASGFEVGSLSTQNYLRTMTGEFNREIAGLRKMRNTSFAADLVSTFAGGLSGSAGALSDYLKANPTGGNSGGGLGPNAKSTANGGYALPVGQGSAGVDGWGF